MKKILIALLATASMSLGAYALAHDARQANYHDSSRHEMAEHGFQHGKKAHRSFLKRMTKELNLSDEQVVAIKALHEQERNERPVRSHDNNIMKLDPSSADYSTNVAEIAATKAAEVEKSIISRGALHAQVFALLTPEQQEKAKQLKLKHRERKDQK